MTSKRGKASSGAPIRKATSPKATSQKSRSKSVTKQRKRKAVRNESKRKKPLPNPTSRNASKKVPRKSGRTHTTAYRIGTSEIVKKDDKSQARRAKRTRRKDHAEGPDRKKFKPGPMDRVTDMYDAMSIRPSSDDEDDEDPNDPYEWMGASTQGPAAGSQRIGSDEKDRRPVGDWDPYGRSNGSDKVFRWPNSSGKWHFAMTKGWGNADSWIRCWDSNLSRIDDFRSVIQPGIILKAPCYTDHWDQRHDHARGDFTSNKYPTPFGYIIAKLRYLIVLKVFRNSYTCLPLLTYGNRLVSQTPIHDMNEHISIRDHRLHRPDGRWANQWPAYVKVQGVRAPIDTEYLWSGRLEYLKPYSVVKMTDPISRGLDWPVDFVGYVTKDSYRRLYTHFKDFFCGETPERPEAGEYRLPFDDLDDDMLLPPPENWDNSDYRFASYRIGSRSRGQSSVNASSSFTGWRSPSEAESWANPGSASTWRSGHQGGVPTGPAGATRSRTQNTDYEYESYDPPARGSRGVPSGPWRRGGGRGGGR